MQQRRCWVCELRKGASEFDDASPHVESTTEKPAASEWDARGVVCVKIDKSAATTIRTRPTNHPCRRLPIVSLFGDVAISDPTQVIDTAGPREIAVW